MIELNKLKLNLRAIEDTYQRDNSEKIQEAINKIIEAIQELQKEHE